MKNIILKYGIFGGIAASIVMALLTAYMNSNPEETPSMFIGVLTMLLAYTFIVLGILKFIKQNNNDLSFGKAFLCGLGITFISSTIYVAVWLIIFYNFFPNFMEHYTELVLKNTPPEELVAKKIDMAIYKEIYKTPLGIIGVTYMEIFPFGIAVALISALILKKK